MCEYSDTVAIDGDWNRRGGVYNVDEDHPASHLPLPTHPCTAHVTTVDGCFVEIYQSNDFQRLLLTVVFRNICTCFQMRYVTLILIQGAYEYNE